MRDYENICREIKGAFGLPPEMVTNEMVQVERIRRVVFRAYENQKHIYLLN